MNSKRTCRPITEREARIVEVLGGIGLPARRIAAHLTERLGYPVDDDRVKNIRVAAGIPAPSRAEPPTPEAIAAALEELYGDALRVVVLRPSVEPELQELAA